MVFVMIWRNGFMIINEKRKERKKTKKKMPLCDEWSSKIRYSRYFLFLYSKWCCWCIFLLCANILMLRLPFLLYITTIINGEEIFIQILFSRHCLFAFKLMPTNLFVFIIKIIFFFFLFFFFWVKWVRNRIVLEF